MKKRQKRGGGAFLLTAFALRHWRRAARCLLMATLLLTSLPSQAGQLVLEQSLTAPDGLTRWYHYYKPEGLAANAPVIILLHGATLSYNKVIDQTRGNAQQAGFGNLDTTQWVDIADEAGALLIIPNGVSPTGDDKTTNDTKGETQSWNDCRNADEASAIETGADDVGFIARLMDWSRASFNTDPNRVYVTGHSNGGTMSYRVAAELGDRVAAVAAFIANLPVDPSKECAKPAHPISVFMLNSTTDPVMNYAGGCDTTTGARGCTLSAQATRDFWIAHNRTASARPAVHYPNLDQRDGAQQGGSTVSSIIHSGGNEHTEVAVYVVEGGGHNGPHIRYKLAAASEATTGLQNHDVDGVRQAWDFIKTKTLRSGVDAPPPAPLPRACKAASASAGPVIDETTTRPAIFPWQGEFHQDDSICFLARQSGAELRAYLFAPANLAQRPDASLPVVVIGPGSGSSQALYHIWSARELAGHGYIVLAVDPQGAGRSEANGEPESCGPEGCPGVPFQQADNYSDGLLSGLDFMFSDEHPWLRKAGRNRAGVAGHSLLARAASFVGGIDLRVQAVVAWDNMSSTVDGDAGVSSGGGGCGALIGGEPPGEPRPVTLRVPTLGEASDRVPGCDPTNTDPEIKKTGYERWRAAGIPAMEVVIRDAVHGDWAQSRQSIPQQLESFQYYTRAWFDLYLKNDAAARDKLLAAQVPLSTVTLARADLLSAGFRSAVFMPDARIDCADLGGKPCIPTPLPLPPVISDVANQTVDEDATTADLVFTIGDADTALSALTLEAVSSNPSLVPHGNIVLAGSGANRSVTIRPLPNQFGLSSITLTVSDGSNVVADMFVLTVNPVNDAPVISGIADQLIRQDSATAALAFTLDDVETATDALTITAVGLSGGPFTLRASGDGLLQLRLNGSSLRRATGACVQNFSGLSLQLQLSTTACEIQLEH